MKNTLSLSIALALVLVAAPARAQDRAAAEAAFREGRALMQKNRHAEACNKFRLSQQLDPAVGTLTNLGVCHEKLGKLASAWAELNEAADLAAGAGQSDRAEQIRERARALEPRLSRLLVRFAGERPRGLKVSRDGRDVTVLLGIPAPVDSGTYEIEARSDATKTWTQRIEVAGEGETVTIEIPTLEPIEMIEEREPGRDEVGSARRPVDPASGPTPGDTILDQPDRGPGDPMRRRRYIALGIGAGGVAAAATGLFFGVRARSKYDDSLALCDDENRCTPEGLGLRDSAFTNANISNVIVGVGVAAIAGGTVLWFLSRSGADADDHDAQIVPAAGPDHVVVSLLGSF